MYIITLFYKLFIMTLIVGIMIVWVLLTSTLGAEQTCPGDCFISNIFGLNTSDCVDKTPDDVASFSKTILKFKREWTENKG